MKSFVRVQCLSVLALGLMLINASEVVVDDKGDLFTVRETVISEMYQGQPYEGLIEIPGFVEAEYFDIGGQGIAYNNIEANVPMPDNVIRYEENGEKIAIQINDVAASTNPGSSEEDGAIAVGMGMSGEWMRYSVFVPVSGKYLPTWRIATFDGNDGPAYVGVKLVFGNGEEENPCEGEGGGGLNMEVNTMGWKTFESFDGAEIDIAEGDHVMAICLDDIMNFEINYVSFQMIEAELPSIAVTPVVTKPFSTVSTMTSETTMSSSTMTATMAPTMAPTMSPTMSPTMTPSMMSSDSAGNLVNAVQAMNFRAGGADEQCIPLGEPCSETLPCCDMLVCYLTKTCEVSGLVGNDRYLESNGGYRKTAATFTGGLAALLGFFHA